MRPRSLLLLLACSIVLLSGCDRDGIGGGPPDDDPEIPERGTMEARIEATTNGFELMNGPATFAMTEDSSAIVLMFRSPNFGREDTTRLALKVPLEDGLRAGTYAFSDFVAPTPGSASSCFFSSLFPDGIYRSDAGTVTFSAATSEVMVGTFDFSMYLRFLVAPGTFGRRDLTAAGSFFALPAPDGGLVENDAVLRCDV